LLASAVAGGLSCAAPADGAAAIAADWQALAVPRVVTARQLRLYVGAELTPDETAASGVAATTGGSPHSNIACVWTHLDFAPETDYLLNVRHTGPAGGGIMLDAARNRREIRLPRQDEGWHVQQVGPLRPQAGGQLVLYGPVGLKIDLVYFTETGRAAPTPAPRFDSWSGPAPAGGLNWRPVRLPEAGEAKHSFGRCGVVLLRRKLRLREAGDERLGVFLLSLGRPSHTQRVEAFLDGRPLLAREDNSFVVPCSPLDAGRDSVLAVRILANPDARTPRPHPGCTVHGPVTLDFHPAPAAPAWTGAWTLRDLGRPGAGIAVRIEKPELRAGELCKVRFFLLERDRAAGGTPAVVRFGGQEFPTDWDLATGEYVTWVSSRRPGAIELRVELQCGDVVSSAAVGTVAVRERTAPAFVHPDEVLIGLWITPPWHIGELKKTDWAQRQAHYRKLFPLLKQHGVNSLNTASFLDPRETALIRRLSAEYGFHLVARPFVLEHSELSSAPATMFKTIAGVVQEWADCPNLLAYGLWDEISMEAAKHWRFPRAILEGLDPAHPATVVLNMNHAREQQFLDTAIMHRDIYYGLPAFAKEVREGADIADRLGVPLWITMGSGRPPAELPTYCWISLAYGAKALFFYHGYAVYAEGSPYRGMIKLPDLELLPQMAAVAGVAHSVRGKLPGLASMSSAPPAAEVRPPGVIATTRIAPDGTRFVFVVNPDLQTPRTVEVVLSAELGRTIRVDELLADEKVAISQDLSFPCRLEAGGARVYRIAAPR